MKKLFATLCIAASVVALVSCKSEEVLPKAYCDTFVISKKVDGVTVHGLGFYTYANVPMGSVVAESESGEVYQLNSYGSNTYEYYKETSAENFNTAIPETGLYTFTVVPTNGDVLTEADALSGAILEPVNLTTCEFNPTNNRIQVAWELSEDADYGVIVLRNANGEAVYYSSTLASTTASGNIPASNWLDGYSPVDGATYTVELNLFLREGSSSDFLAAKAISSQDVVWGEGAAE